MALWSSEYSNSLHPSLPLPPHAMGHSNCQSIQTLSTPPFPTHHMPWGTLIPRVSKLPPPLPSLPTHAVGHSDPQSIQTSSTPSFPTHHMPWGTLIPRVSKLHPPPLPSHHILWGTLIPRVSKLHPPPLPSHHILWGTLIPRVSKLPPPLPLPPHAAGHSNPLTFPLPSSPTTCCVAL